MKIVVTTALSTLLSGCVANSYIAQTSDSALENNKRSVIYDFIQKGRWAGAYRSIENNFLLTGEQDKAVPILKDYPQILSIGAYQALKKGCASQPMALAAKREAMLKQLQGEGFQVSKLSRIVSRCEVTRAAYALIKDPNDIKNQIPCKTRSECIRKMAEVKDKVEAMRDDAIAKRDVALKKAVRQKAQLKAYKSATKNAEIYCPTEALCNKVFALSQIYVHENSRLKIQTSTSNIIETYPPHTPSDIALSIYRTPIDNGENISLKAYCQEANAESDYCFSKRIKILNGFRAFLTNYISL